jgi:hypothetical protein
MSLLSGPPLFAGAPPATTPALQGGEGQDSSQMQRTGRLVQGRLVATPTTTMRALASSSLHQDSHMEISPLVGASGYQASDSPPKSQLKSQVFFLEDQLRLQHDEMRDAAHAMLRQQRDGFERSAQMQSSFANERSKWYRT